MNRVIVDPTTLARLGDARQTLELCDDSGRLVGHFVPADSPFECDEREAQVSDPPHPLLGRCQGMLTVLSEDDEHVKDWTEYMP